MHLYLALKNNCTPLVSSFIPNSMSIDVMHAFYSQECFQFFFFIPELNLVLQNLNQFSLASMMKKSSSKTTTKEKMGHKL